MSLWTEFLHGLSQPEYVHVLLNPLPVYGLAAGLFALLVARLSRNRSALMLALVVTFVGAVSVWPAAHFGEAGYDRVYSMSDAAAQPWLNWHRHLANVLVWIDSAAAGLCLASLAALWKIQRIERSALIVTTIVALAGLGFGGFVGYVGGKIRHSEFRSGPPPAWADTKSPYDD